MGAAVVLGRLVALVVEWREVADADSPAVDVAASLDPVDLLAEDVDVEATVGEDLILGVSLVVEWPSVAEVVDAFSSDGDLPAHPDSVAVVVAVASSAAISIFMIVYSKALSNTRWDDLLWQDKHCYQIRRSGYHQHPSSFETPAMPTKMMTWNGFVVVSSTNVQ